MFKKEMYVVVGRIGNRGEGEGTGKWEKLTVYLLQRQQAQSPPRIISLGLNYPRKFWAL